MITGAEYPPTPQRAATAQIISVLQWIFISLVVIGETIFGYLGLPTDSMKKLQENKLAYLMGAMFVGSQLRAACLQSGAFEISIDDTLVFSKLQTGRIFQPQELKLLLLENGISLSLK